MRKLLALVIFCYMFLSVYIVVESGEAFEDPLLEEVVVSEEIQPLAIIKEEYNMYEDIATQYIDKMSELETTDDKMEWFKEYKRFVASFDYEDKPETICDWFENEEIELLFKVVQREVGDEYGFDEKANVASVIFNRLKDGRFGNSLTDILKPSQFHVLNASNFNDTKVSEKTILAVQYAFEIEDTTDGCIFFEKNTSIHESYAEFVFEDAAGHKFYR